MKTRTLSGLLSAFIKNRLWLDLAGIHEEDDHSLKAEPVTLPESARVTGWD